MKQHIQRLAQGVVNKHKEVWANKQVRRVTWLILVGVALFTMGLAILTTFKWQKDYMVARVVVWKPGRLLLLDSQGRERCVLVDENWDEEYKLSSKRAALGVGSRVIVLGKETSEGCTDPWLIREIGGSK